MLDFQLLDGDKNIYLACVFFDSSGNILSDGMSATIAYIMSAAIAYASKGASYVKKKEISGRNHRF